MRCLESIDTIPEGSIPSSTSGETGKDPRLLRHDEQELDYRHDKLVRGALSKYFFEWAEEYAQRHERTRAWHCFSRYLGGRPLNANVPVNRILSLIARLTLPGRLDSR